MFSRNETVNQKDLNVCEEPNEGMGNCLVKKNQKFRRQRSLGHFNELNIEHILTMVYKFYYFIILLILLF